MEIQNSGTKIVVIGKFVMTNCAIIVIGNRLTSTENVLQTKLHVEIKFILIYTRELDVNALYIAFRFL